MVKTIKIGNIEETFKSSAALPIIYKMETQREFFDDVIKMQEDIAGVGYRMAHVMYKHAGGDKDFIEFLSQFELMELTEVIADLLSMILEDNTKDVDAKLNSAE